MFKTAGYVLPNRFDHLEFGHSGLFRISDFGFRVFPLSEQLREHALSARGGDAYPLPGRRREIAEAVPHPEIHVGSNRLAGEKQRNVLPRVVSRGIRGLAAVIGRYEEEVLRPEGGLELREQRVARREVLRVSGGVVAMSVLAVEVDQVGED